MKTPTNKAKTAKVEKMKVPLKNRPVTSTPPEEPDALDKAEAALNEPADEAARQMADSEALRSEPFAGKGDHDKDGKPGGDIKAQSKEPRPMPKDFAPTISIEGSRVVARQDGIEVPFINTEDRKFYAEQAEQQKKTLWRELERRRIKAIQ